MPMVSIAVPVYNSAKFLPQCLDSLLNQTYRDIEVLCVNDGSTDNSLEILQEYAHRDDRVHVFTKENEGKGAASARNLGLDHATGKYIQFLDSDDFFESDMVELCVQKMEETEAETLIFGANRYDDQKKRVTMPYVSIQLQYAPQQDTFTYQDCPDRIFDIGYLVAWNKMYRTDFLRQYNLRFEAIPISDDQYVPCLALVFARRLAVINRAFVNYRFNTGSSQVSNYHKHPDSAFLATYSVIREMRQHNVYEAVKRSYLNSEIHLLRDYFDKMTEYRTLKYLYDVYRTEVFPFFDAENLTQDFFNDHRLWEWYEMIQTRTLEDILMMSARGYGNVSTTSILRFQVPYEKIPQGGQIVLLGKGVAGRHWYAQLILSGYCDVVCWTEDESEIPSGLEYDAILRAQ